MKTLITILSTILIVSCQSTTQRLACNGIRTHQIPPIAKCEASFTFVRCRCRCFDYNNWKTLDLNKCERFKPHLLEAFLDEKNQQTVDMELSFCDGIDGSFAADQAVDMRPHVKALADIRENLCKF